MKKIGDFFKKIKVKEQHIECTKSNKNEQIEISIEGNRNLFKDEEDKILEGAKQLLQLGKAENMEDAIITFAVMFRGLKFKEIQKSADKTIVVLRETARDGAEIQYDGTEER